MNDATARDPGKAFVVVLGLITVVGPLSIHFFLPVLPQVKAAFAVSDALAQVTFSVTLATMAFMTLIYGAMSDRYGRRPVLLTGLGLFVCGSVLAALATSVQVLVIARLIQAAGAGCGVAMARAIARDAYGPERLVSAIAYLTMAYTLGPMLAPPLGGLLGVTVGWRGVFWTAAAFGLVVIAAVVAALYETHTERGQGGARLSRIPADVVRLFSHLRFAAFVSQSGFSSGTFFTLAAGSTFLMQNYLGRSAADYGLYFLLFPFGYCLGNFISSRLSGRVSVERMVLVGSVFIVASVAGQAGFLLAGIVTPLVIFVPGFFLSLAQGIALPSAQAGALRIVPELSGTAAGIGVFMQMICGAAFSQLFGLMADGTHLPMIFAMSVAAILTLIAGLAVWSTRPR